MSWAHAPFPSHVKYLSASFTESTQRDKTVATYVEKRHHGGKRWKKDVSRRCLPSSFCHCCLTAVHHLLSSLSFPTLFSRSRLWVYGDFDCSCIPSWESHGDVWLWSYNFPADGNWTIQSWLFDLLQSHPVVEFTHQSLAHQLAPASQIVLPGTGVWLECMMRYFS